MPVSGGIFVHRNTDVAPTLPTTPSAPPQSVLDVVSLILWSLILIISLKYAILICRADNRAEGEIVALVAVLRARHARPGTWRSAVLMLGLLGAALLYGDGAITPATRVVLHVGIRRDAIGARRRAIRAGAGGAELRDSVRSILLHRPRDRDPDNAPRNVDVARSDLCIHAAQRGTFGCVFLYPGGTSRRDRN